MSNNVHLYCWKRDCPNPHTTPLEVAKQECTVQPVWNSLRHFQTSAGRLVDIGCPYIVGRHVRCLISVRFHRAWLQVDLEPNQDHSAATADTGMHHNPVVSILDASDSTRRNVLGGTVKHPPGSGFLRTLDRHILQEGRPCFSEGYTDLENPEWQNFQIKEMGCSDLIRGVLGLEEESDLHGQFDEYSGQVFFYNERVQRICIAQALPR